MAIQRNRQTAGSEGPPDRQIVRKGLTDFEEGMSPPSLSMTGPTRVGDTTVGRIAVDDGLEGPKLQLVDGTGVRWRDPTDSATVNTIRHSYKHDPATGKHSRQGIWAVDDVSGSDLGTDFGSEVARAAFITVNNNKLAGDEGSVDAENRAFIDLICQVDEDGSQALLRLEASNEGTSLLVQLVDSISLLTNEGGTVELGGDVLANGKALAQGALSFGTISGPTDLSVTPGTYTAIVGNAEDVPVKAGHAYRITFWNDGSIVTGSTASGNRWDGKFQRSTNGGSTWQDITSGKVIYRTTQTVAQRFTVPVFTAIYQPATDADVRWQWLVAKTIGASTTSAIEGDNFILVEHLGEGFS